MGVTSSVDLASTRNGVSAPKGPRVANVDVLRAVAALAVLAVHAYYLGGRPLPVRAQHAYDVPLITLSTGVWLFFGISGYVISRPFVERLTAGEALPATVPYALRRGLRIFPLYWVALTVIIAIDGDAGTRAWQLPFHYLLLNNLIPGRQVALFPAAWTLTLEALFYIAVPILAFTVRGRRQVVPAEQLARVVVASWVASVAFTIFADSRGDGQIGLWLRGSLPAMWQMFCPGILLAIAPHLRGTRWRRWLVELPRTRAATALAVVALVAAALLGAAAPLRFGIVPYELLADASRPLFAVGYALVIAAAIRGRPWGRRARWPLELGLISYGIYLLHPLLVSLLVRVHASPLHQNTLLAFAVNFACIAVVTIPLALISWRCFEQPLTRLGRRTGARSHVRGKPIGA